MVAEGNGPTGQDGLFQQVEPLFLQGAAAPGGEIHADPGAAVLRRAGQGAAQLGQRALGIAVAQAGNALDARQHLAAFGLAEGGAVQHIAFQQRDAAARAPLGVHGHAGGAQGVNVPADGPLRHLEMARQLAGAHAALVL